MYLKAGHVSGSAFCTEFSRLEVPEQALGGIPLGLELVVKINLLNIHVYVCKVDHCMHVCIGVCTMCALINQIRLPLISLSQLQIRNFALQCSVAFQCFYFVPSQVSRNERSWKQWFDKEAPEEAQIPDGYHISLDSFRKLLLIRYVHNTQGLIAY